MLVGGVLLLCVGVIGFLCLCTYAAVKVPEWSAMEILRFGGKKRAGCLVSLVGGTGWFSGGQFVFFCTQKKAKFSRFGFKLLHVFLKTNG